jgi:hypothetical protein
MCKELHYEGGFFIQKVYFALKIFMTEGSQNSDSNLVALNRACEYWLLISACDDHAMVQKNEIEIKEVQPLLRFS